MAGLCYTINKLLNLGWLVFKQRTQVTNELWQRLKTLGVRKPCRGTKAGKSQSRSISPVIKTRVRNLHQFSRGINIKNLVPVEMISKLPTIITTQRDQIKHGQHGINVTNLTIVKQLSSNSTQQHVSPLDLCFLNVRSMRNKTEKIKDFIVENNYDVSALAETWLSPGDKDLSVIAEVVPTGFKILHQPRESGRGGGLAVIYKDNIDIKLLSSNGYRSFEHMEFFMRTVSKCIRLCVVYCPPPSAANGLTIKLFMDEFTTLLTHLNASSGHLLIIGDFNFHLDDRTSSSACQFSELYESFSLHQLVTESTHHHGHILDLVLTKSSDKILTSVNVIPADSISDHQAVSFCLESEKPSFSRKLISYRKLKSIDIPAFIHDVTQSPLSNISTELLSSAIKQYDEVLAGLLDRHAPLKQKVLTVRPKAAWYKDEIAFAKRSRRKLERQWRNTRLEIHRQIYKEQCNVVSKLIHQARQQYYNGLILEHASDQKALFQVIDKLLNKKRDSPLPSHDSAVALAEKFAEYFTEKVEKIRSNLGGISDTDTVAAPAEQPNANLTSFNTVIEDEVRKCIMNSATKSCSLDVIPTWLLKKSLGVLLSPITRIVNLSLSQSMMPTVFKEAVITPILKKSSLDPENLKNYRPVSNLSFISKLIERIVASKLTSYLENNSLLEPLQSAYKKYHSTETALVKIQNDILRNLDSNSAVALVFLDLSAAFDTVDHHILLNLLSSRMGISGAALKWIESYLTDRFHSVSVKGAHSSKQKLKYGVPQGSVLGPILFTLYVQPVGDIVRQHGVNFHLYADDTQLYLSFKPSVSKSVESARTTLERCIADICIWMNQNMLKLNQDKTEFLIIQSRHSRNKSSYPLRELTVGNTSVIVSSSAKNIGVTFDSVLNMDSHVKLIAKQAYWHLHNIGRIRPYLTRRATETLVHAFVTSKLDYGNAVLHGLPSTLLSRLQHVQNAAARLITGTKKFDHITPVLQELHWLPVEQRIRYKIALLTFKALHNQAPSYIQELVQIYNPARSLRSEELFMLQVPRTRTVSFGDRAFSKAGPYLWNSLPTSIRLCEKLSTFKKSLKTYLFQGAYVN